MTTPKPEVALGVLKTTLHRCKCLSAFVTV